nr:hypothetical protein [Tanacetum cinerariifolium]
MKGGRVMRGSVFKKSDEGVVCFVTKYCSKKGGKEVGKAHRNHRPQADSWNANITNNKVALQSSTLIEPNTYHNKDIGEDLVSQSTITQIVSSPLDIFGILVMKSMVIFSYFHQGILGCTKNLKASYVQLDNDADIAAAETAAALEVDIGIEANVQVEVGIGIEREYEVKEEADSGDRGTIKIRVDRVSDIKSALREQGRKMLATNV